MRLAVARFGSAARAADGERALREQTAWRASPFFQEFTNSEDTFGAGFGNPLIPL
jgi:hypothetical protein